MPIAREVRDAIRQSLERVMHFKPGLILDSRVVIAQFPRNSLFFKALLNALARGRIPGESPLISNP